MREWKDDAAVVILGEEEVQRQIERGGGEARVAMRWTFGTIWILFW